MLLRQQQNLQSSLKNFQFLLQIKTSKVRCRSSIQINYSIKQIYFSLRKCFWITNTRNKNTIKTNAEAKIRISEGNTRLNNNIKIEIKGKSSFKYFEETKFRKDKDSNVIIGIFFLQLDNSFLPLFNYKAKFQKHLQWKTNNDFNIYRIPTELDSHWLNCAGLTVILTHSHHKLSSENNAARHCVLIYSGFDKPCRQSYSWEEAYSMYTVKMYFNFLG